MKYVWGILDLSTSWITDSSIYFHRKTSLNFQNGLFEDNLCFLQNVYLYLLVYMF